MQLVVLAAGHGRRYGGLKQLAPVGPNGESIMDYTAFTAESCGIDGAVLVVREDIREEIEEHVRRYWPSSLPVEYVVQPPIPGTAQAVHAVHSVVDGTFIVVNADDLYGNAIVELKEDLDRRAGTDEAHVLVGYKLRRTVLTADPVTRGLVEIADDGHLAMIVEHKAAIRADGKFDVRPLPSNEPDDIAALTHMEPRILSGNEPVSMNLWGFHKRLFDHLAEVIAAFDPTTAPREELLLPDVIGHLVATGIDRVQVIHTSSRCVGLTHPGDLAILKEEFALTAGPASDSET